VAQWQDAVEREGGSRIGRGGPITAAARRALRAPFTGRAFRETLYALLSLPLGLLGLGAVLATLLLGILSAGAIILPLLPLFLAMDRGLARIYRLTAAGLLGLRVARPVRSTRRPGVLGFLVYHLADPVAWRAVGYLAIRFPLGMLQFAVGFVPRVYGSFLIAFPALWHLDPHTVREVDAHGVVHHAPSIGQYYFDTWPRALMVVGAGVVVLLVSPWLTRAVIAPDRWLMPRLLGPSAAELRIQELEETRATAINEAALTLRRIERDLHDGIQARLVSLGMRLSRAEGRLDVTEPDAAGAVELIRASREETRELIHELRELVRGIHPPALDAGLEPALTTLAARSPIPATVRVELPTRPEASVETMLYFCAAELLTNAGKHSKASTVAITVLSDGTFARLIVTDDGRGGATLDGAGSGLRGLAERVRTIDGTIDLDSPTGGPTTVTLQVPVRM
jgi:signal transduction histidine kinase